MTDPARQLFGRRPVHCAAAAQFLLAAEGADSG